MTAEKQYVDDFESAYQGKAWSKGKIFGIMTVVCLAMAIRDIGMSFVYGSIYDKLLEDPEASISFFNYVFMVLLYALPLVLPMILRFTNGAYDNEIEGSLMPSFNSKALNIIMYIVVGIVCVIPVVLLATGIFTSAYMFVALNLALLIFTSVTVFYYLGTYMLQRAKASLPKKYVIPTVMMIITSAASFVLSIGVTVGLHFLNVGSIITHLSTYFNKQVMDSSKKIVASSLIEFIAHAVLMFIIVALACVIAGWLYNFTQNIIYAGVPTMVFAYSNIILLQRAKECSAFIATASKNLANYRAKLDEATSKNIAKDIANYTQKIQEVENNLPLQQIGMILSYVLIGVMVAVLVAIGIRALVGMKQNLKEAKSKK